MAEDWRKIDRGLFESPDGQWRISNPWRLKTELRHRWLVAQRRSDAAGWHMHDSDHATLHDARAYVATLSDAIAAASGSAREREKPGPRRMTDGERHAWGQAYRHGSLICDRTRVTLRDDQLGAAPHQRRTIFARFDGRLHPTLRAELTELAQCHGAAGRRVAERIEPIVLLLGDPHHGRERIVGHLLPPQAHGHDLREVGFRVRELRPLTQHHGRSLSAPRSRVGGVP